MATQEIPSNGQKVINVVLKETAIGLEEVVVTGYSSQRKKDIAGAASVVDVKGLTLIPAALLSDALQGEASGVNVISLGAPRAANQIFLRGIGSCWGILGSQSNISANNAYTLWGSSISTSYYDIAGTNNSSQKGFYQTQNRNIGTSWGKDIISNFGIDAALIKNKVDPIGHSTILTGAPDDENSIANPTKVVPETSTFTAGISFNYSFPANSVTVLRIKSSKPTSKPEY